jgi:hypothetical protein
VEPGNRFADSSRARKRTEAQARGREATEATSVQKSSKGRVGDGAPVPQRNEGRLAPEE